MDQIIKSIITIKKMEAPEGWWLSRVPLTTEQVRTFARVAFLGQSETESNWELITTAEKEAYEAKIQEDEKTNT